MYYILISFNIGV